MILIHKILILHFILISSFSFTLSQYLTKPENCFYHIFDAKIKTDSLRLIYEKNVNHAHNFIWELRLSHVPLQLQTKESFSAKEAQNHSRLFIRGSNQLKKYIGGCTIHLHFVDSYYYNIKQTLTYSSTTVVNHLNLDSTLPIDTPGTYVSKKYIEDVKTTTLDLFTDKVLSSSPNFVYFVTHDDGDSSKEYYERAIYSNIHLFVFYSTVFMAIHNGAHYKICVYCYMIPSFDKSNRFSHLQPLKTNIMENLDLLKKNWLADNRNLNGLRIKNERVWTFNLKSKTNCELGVRDFSIPKIRAEICAYQILFKRLNASIVLKSEKEKNSIPAMLNNFDGGYYTRYNIRNHFVNFKTRTRQYFEPYCVQYLDYELKYFVHKNATNFNVYAALASAYDISCWICILILAIMLIMLCIIFQKNSDQKRSGVILTSLSIFSALVSQINSEFYEKCQKRSNQLGAILILWTTSMNILCNCYSGICVASIASKNIPSLPENLERLLNQSSIPLITSYKIGHTGYADTISYIRSQIVGHELHYGLFNPRLTRIYSLIYNNLYERVSIKGESFYHIPLFANLTFGIPLQLYRREFRDYSPGAGMIDRPIYKMVKLFNGIVAFLDSLLDRSIYSALSHVSNQYEIFEDKRHYSEKVEFENKEWVHWNEHMFLGEFFHDKLGTLDNMGIHNNWVKQAQQIESIKRYAYSQWKHEIQNRKLGSNIDELEEGILNFTNLKSILQLFTIATISIILVFFIEAQNIIKRKF